MRTARIKEEGAAYYHVISRIVDRQRLLDDGEKERWRELLHKTAGFSGVEVLAWTILDNHWLCEASHNQCYVERVIMWSVVHPWLRFWGVFLTS